MMLMACGKSQSSRQNTRCQRAALTDNQLDGDSLSSKQLALTFDDGPGTRTLELSSYLHAQGIRATFFVNGHCFYDSNPCGNQLSPSEVFGQVKADGHLIGNHTQDHYNLTDTSRFPIGAAGDALIVSELSATDDLINGYVPFFLFRAPYGAWNDRDQVALQSSSMGKYVGPINWNIGGAMTVSGYAADWDCWQNTNGFGAQTTEQCGNRYLSEIEQVGHGITLMHDAIYTGLSPLAGNTVDMVKYLVPLLKGKGYTFVRADEVPKIAEALSIPIPPPPPPEPKDASDDANDASENDAGDAGTLVDASVKDGSVSPPSSSSPPPISSALPPPLSAPNDPGDDCQ